VPIQAAEQAWDACARQTCLIPLPKQTKHRPSNTKAKEMLFDRMFDGLQILSTTVNTIKEHQTRWPNGKNVLVTKQCLIVMVVAKHFPFRQVLKTSCPSS